MKIFTCLYPGALSVNLTARSDMTGKFILTLLPLVDLLQMSLGPETL